MTIQREWSQKRYWRFYREGEKEGILGGRHYFDLEKRNDEWRIKHRLTIFDWNQNQDASAIWSDKILDKYRGKRDYTEASYDYIEKEKKK